MNFKIKTLESKTLKPKFNEENELLNVVIQSAHASPLELHKPSDDV